MVYGGSNNKQSVREKHDVARSKIPATFLWRFYGRAMPMTAENLCGTMRAPNERRFSMKECIKCKNPLPIKAEYCPNCGQEQPKPKEKVPKKKRRKDLKEPAEPQIDLGTYYDDIVPEDAEELKNRRVDNPIILRLILLGFGVAIVLAACVAIMIFLGG